MGEKNAKYYGWSVILASWMAVFCLFGYRAVFAILKGPMGVTLGWSASQVTLGYSLMMVFYAVTAYFSGMILDKWGTKPVYSIAAVFGALGFLLTARINTNLAYLFTFGLLGGIATGMLWVTSTVSVRKWYVGKTYATMWGLAFAGGPMAQFVLAQLVKPSLGATQSALDKAVMTYLPNASSLSAKDLSVAIALKLKDPAVLMHANVREAMQHLDHAWRHQMTLLGVIVFIALVVAVLVAKHSPEHYGLKPFGDTPSAAGGSDDYEWTLGAAFSKYAIWAAILTFLTCAMGEFLIWTQVVSFWTTDAGFNLKKATNTYAVIGLIGIASMPLMGKVADKVVQMVGSEVKGRKIMLVVGPLVAVVACIFLLNSAKSSVFAYIACAVFAVYWAIIPGGVVGYTGAIYGRKTLGKLWGLATMIVMGIGPFAGSYIGSLLRDLSGRYIYSIYFALGVFVLAFIFAMTLPQKIDQPQV